MERKCVGRISPTKLSSRDFVQLENPTPSPSPLPPKRAHGPGKVCRCSRESGLGDRPFPPTTECSFREHSELYDRYRQDASVK